MKPRKYTITDGKLVLTITPFPKGVGFLVTCPFDPALITEAKSVPEAFVMARDAMSILQKTRRRIAKKEGRQAKAG